MNLDNLYIRFDDGEHLPVNLKCSSIITIQEFFYHPDKLDDNGNILRSADNRALTDYGKMNPLLRISCSDCNIVKVHDMTLDEFMIEIKRMCNYVTDYDCHFYEKIFKNYAYCENELKVYVN